MRKEHGKLVRDRIPGIIVAAGDVAVTRVLEGDEYRQALIAKLREECDEFIIDPSVGELADVLEVVRALASLIASPGELERVRLQKLAERGGFEERIYLESTES